MSATSQSFRNGSPPNERRRPAESPSDGGNLVDQMKKYVAQVITLCNTVVLFLEEHENVSSKQTGNNQKPASGAATAATDTSRHDESISYLKQKLKELVEMNVTWQQSHQMQDQRIAELEEQIRQMSLHRGTGGLDEQQQAEIDRLLLDQKNKYRQLEDEKLLLVDENLELRQGMDALSEKVQILEMQLLVNREDFESERKDRERAQSRIAELEQELERYRPQPQPHPASVLAPYRYPGAQLYTGQGSQQWTRRLIAAGGGGYSADRTDALDATDCVEDSSLVARGSSGGTLTVDGASASDDLLMCPNCRQAFTTDQHEQLMDHMDRCASR